MRPDALSMNTAAFRIASSSASAQSAAGAIGPVERNSSRNRLAISTTAPPTCGCSSRPIRRARTGTAAVTMPNTA